MENMYYDFDIAVFNKELQNGDLGALKYIKKTILDNLKVDAVKMNRVDYLWGLYNGVIALNNCVIATEQCSYATEINGIYDKYAELRDLLFEELGLVDSDGRYYIGEEK
jgi:hypothetical protein